MLWLLVAPAVALMAVLAARPLVRRWWRAREVVHTTDLDPDFDMTELLARRGRGEIDEAAFGRLRDRFEQRRQAEGLSARPRALSPIIEPPPDAPGER
jgi:hypothetical protein